MEIASKYNPGKVEDKWYAYWLEHGFFQICSRPARSIYDCYPTSECNRCAAYGPYAQQYDSGCPRSQSKRLLGKNACWVPGTDHASIATEAKVTAQTEGRRD